MRKYRTPSTVDASFPGRAVHSDRKRDPAEYPKVTMVRLYTSRITCEWYIQLATLKPRNASAMNDGRDRSRMG